MKHWKKVISLISASVLIFLAVIFLAGRTSESDSSMASGSVEAGSLDGITISVGSKDFGEQLILGEMMVQAFEAAGATVENNVNLGGTAVARAALESGEIDVYMEYNGTGWTNHLGLEDPSFDSDELTQGVRERDLEQNGIVWIGQSPFNNTYGFASSPEVTEANGGPFDLKSMMEYVRDNPDAVVCMESEFPSRPDGLILTENHSGIKLPEAQQRILETGIIYTETAENNCTFGEVFTTDGRIPALNMTLVEDPGVNIIYNVSATMREDLYNQAPEVFDSIVAQILAPLSNEKMAELNARESAEGEEPSVVAADYLAEIGLL